MSAPTPTAEVVRAVKHSEDRARTTPEIRGISSDLQKLRAVFHKHLHIRDEMVIDVPVATYVANKLAGDPVWLLIVGPSGGGKTEAVESVRDLSGIRPVSKLTAKTFLSGMKGKRNSLLNRMHEDGHNFIVMKDFTTVLVQRRESRQEVLGDMREIYDGHLEKEYGNGETATWDGRIGFLGGVTPAIDVHQQAMAILGERFVYLRLPEESDDRIEMVRMAIAHSGGEEEMRTELRQAVKEYVDGLDLTIPEMDPDTTGRIVRLADSVARGRSPVARDEYRQEMQAVPSPEIATRLGKQLAQLWRAFTVMGHEDPFEAVTRIAWNSISPDRLRIIRYVVKYPESTTNEVASAVRMDGRTVLRRLNDLHALDILDRSREGTEGNREPYTWSISETGRRLFVVPREP